MYDYWYYCNNINEIDSAKYISWAYDIKLYNIKKAKVIFNDTCMLNIFNLNLKNKITKPFIINGNTNEIGEMKHFPPASKEWFNSIYAFNKNTSKLSYTTDKFIINMIRSFFNIYSKKLEYNIKSPRLRTWRRRISTNKILVSRAELKHTSDRVSITVYVYNRQKKYYLNKIKKIKILNIIKKKGIKIINKKSFLKRIRLIKLKASKVISNVIKKENVIVKNLNLNKKFSFKDYEITYYKDFILRSLQKEMLYMYYKQILYLNKAKFENSFILNLKNLLYKVYDKKVEINIVNLKYLHLNSDIFTQALALKLRNRKNRLYRVLKTSLLRIKLPYDNKLDMLHDMYDRNEKINSLRINSLINNDKNILLHNDIIDNLLHKLFKLNLLNEFTEDTVKEYFNLIKNKYISGVRIEASGRLSKRITAARSVFKKKYLGTLKNIDSSYKGFSSVILRGHVKSNLQYTKIKSKTRIGSFGIKGWISSN